MNPILCGNPVAQFQSYGHEILQEITRVCQSGPYILGPEVAKFEAEFASFHDVPYGVGVGSGTDALVLTLRAYGIEPGDEVITVSHTALATVAAIVMAGATPVLIDIEEDFFTIDPAKIQAAVTSKTRGIIPVHLYGHPCNMNPIMEIAKEHNLIVVEDCAQAHGATYQGQKVGTFGHAGCFSFYPTKNLGGIGDGGAVITKDRDIAERLKRLRQYGWDEQRIGQEPGVVSRLDEIQAAILRVKLRYLDQDNEKRRKIAQAYDLGLAKSDLILPYTRQESQPAYHLYVVQTQERDALKKKLSAQGIEAGIHYALPAHLHPGYKDRVIVPAEGLLITEQVVQHVLSLPIYPELSDKEVKRSVECIDQCIDYPIGVAR